MPTPVDASSKSQLRSRLLERAQSGDGEAFRALFSDIGPMITRFVRRRIPDPSEVENVCQETLLAIYKSRHTYEPSRPVEPWIFAIAQNVAAQHVRRHHARASWQEPVGDVPDSGVEDETGATLDLERALRRLSHSQLEAIKATKIEGLSLSEVSARTGASVGALKVRVHRAYEILKKSFAR
jgi:RNA polymerase sigma-70 factor (ECF subfamily)